MYKFLFKIKRKSNGICCRFSALLETMICPGGKYEIYNHTLMVIYATLQNLQLQKDNNVPDFTLWEQYCLNY